VRIKIAGKFYTNFNDVTISTSLDAVASSFAFTARFDPANADHRTMVRPLTYPKVEFFHDDGRALCTGTIVYPSFNSSKVPNLVKVSGYSLGGVLEDCKIPHALYPLQSDNRSLKEITERLLKYFNLKLVVYDSAARECNEIISKSVAGPGESIKEYISKIAAQKNVIFSHDVYGNLIFFKPDIKAKSKGFFNKDNALDFGGDYNGQGMHSVLTTIRQPSRSDNDDTADEDEGGDVSGTVESIVNPMVKAIRPHVEVQSAGKETDTSKGVRNALAEELKNIKVGFSITGELYDEMRISIGDVVEVQNDEVYLYKKTRMIIANTIFSEGSNGKNAAITCMLPETFTGDVPKNIFE
jgi:prophage tail gpP-like protein